MSTTPYETLICQPYRNRLTRLKDSLVRANISYPLPPLESPGGNKINHGFVVTPAEEYNDIDVFTQPLNLGTDAAPMWVIDGRPYMRWDRKTGNYQLTAVNDFTFQCHRVALLVAMQTVKTVSATTLGLVPAKTFTRWISLTLTHRFNLALETQINLNVICAYYYLLRFYDDEVTESVLHRLATKVAQISGVQTPHVLSIIEPIGNVQSIQGFINAIANHSGSVRLTQLKFADLFALLATSWVGVNSRENVGVALEDPATLIAIIFSAVDDRSYRKTVLTKRAESAGRPNDLKEFVDQTSRLIRSTYL